MTSLTTLNFMEKDRFWGLTAETPQNTLFFLVERLMTSLTTLNFWENAFVFTPFCANMPKREPPPEPLDFVNFSSDFVSEALPEAAPHKKHQK